MQNSFAQSFKEIREDAAIKEDIIVAKTEREKITIELLAYLTKGVPRE